MSRGIVRERQVKELLVEDGWWVARAAGSFGDADLVALKAGHRPLMVEVKTSAAGPYAHFLPRDRVEIKAAAELAGAEAWLAWHPPRGKLTWLPQSAWPEARREAA